MRLWDVRFGERDEGEVWVAEGGGFEEWTGAMVRRSMVEKKRMRVGLTM